MLNTPVSDDDNFGQRLRKAPAKLQAQAQADNHAQAASSIPDLSQWMQYWNDADSVAGNLRRFEHWLQRARLQRSC